MNFLKCVLIFLAFSNFGINFATIDSHSDLTGHSISYVQDQFFTKRQLRNVIQIPGLFKFFLVSGLTLYAVGVFGYIIMRVLQN